MSLLGRSLLPDGPFGCEPTEADLDRHRELWDERLRSSPGPLELSEFGWWLSSGRLREPADLRRFTATLRLAGGRVGDLRDAVETVARLARTGAGLTEPALEFLEALAAAGTARAQYIGADAVGELLATAMAQPALRARAVALVHRFGEQGFLTLRALLAAGDQPLADR